jgi:hypothetical protein
VAVAVLEVGVVSLVVGKAARRERGPEEQGGPAARCSYS